VVGGAHFDHFAPFGIGGDTLEEEEAAECGRCFFFVSVDGAVVVFFCFPVVGMFGFLFLGRVLFGGGGGFCFYGWIDESGWFFP